MVYFSYDEKVCSTINSSINYNKLAHELVYSDRIIDIVLSTKKKPFITAGTTLTDDHY